MKTNSIIKLLVAIVLLGTNTTILAQIPITEKSFQERVVKRALYGMNSEIPSIVESSLFLILEVKNRYPNEDYTKILDKLNELVSSGKTISIRYKAQLATLFFNYHEQFKEVKITENDNPDKYFRMIAGKIENNSFALN
ncbi:MAG: hypothetical protein AB1298_01295 [Bacteroidota bacterium]